VRLTAQVLVEVKGKVKAKVKETKTVLRSTLEG